MRTIDSTGEFVKLVDVLGGKTISLDGTDGMINPLEVNAVAVREKVDDLGKNVQEIDEVTSFNQHKHKLSTFYGLMNPDAKAKDKQLFRIVIDQFYKDIGLWSADPDKQTNITNLNPEDYPTFSELLQYLRELVYEDQSFKNVRPNISEDRLKQYQSIELTLQDIISSNGAMFDGHTTIENFKQYPIINFSIRQLNAMGTKLKRHNYLT
ncbi:ATPase TraE [Staphylococcus aureus]|uniref:ATPase TraE n=1 Tax=Staphylococcus aureus TaxID=1280 RepID=A0A380EA45_STAAU|nr:ATPase TraE [Staphylococcus aureus]